MARSKNTGVFKKIGGAILGTDKAKTKTKHTARKPRVKSSKKPRQEIPGKLKGFFENRHAGWPEYIMLKAQLAIMVLFVMAVAYLVFLPGANLVFMALLLVPSVYLAHLAGTQLRKAFTRDYAAYRSFVAMCVAIAWVFVLLLKFSPITFSTETLQQAMISPILAICFVAIAFGAFRFKYGRNYTYGVVEETRGQHAVVRVSYDIRSNVKADLYTVDNFAKIKRGDAVKVSVERPMLGLRGSKVKAILGKAR
jgi:uncharacterized membrane protein